MSRGYGLGETLYVRVEEDPQGTYAVLDFPGYDDKLFAPDTVWVPIRDRDGALLIWFGYVTD